MKVKVKYFSGLNETFGRYEDSIELDDRAGLYTLLETICRSAECHEALFDGSGGLRHELALFRNGTVIPRPDRGQTRLADGDEIIILPMVEGG